MIWITAIIILIALVVLGSLLKIEFLDLSDFTLQEVLEGLGLTAIMIVFVVVLMLIPA